MAAAVLGAGAFIDGRRIHIDTSSERKLLPGAVKTRFLPQEYRDFLAHQGGTFADDSDSAGIDYPDLVLGRWRFLLIGTCAGRR